MSTERGQAKLTTEQLAQLKQLLGAVLTLLSLWSLYSLELQSEALLIPATVLTLVLIVRPALAEQIPDRVMRWLTPFLVLIIVGDFVVNAPSFVPSLVRMIVWLLLYRNIAKRRQREDLQLVLLCLFCVVLSGVMTVSLLFALQILLFTPIAMALLFLICILDDGNRDTPGGETWRGFSWKTLLHGVLRVLDYRVLLVCGALFAFVVSVSTLLFILTPRFNLEQAIPFLELESQARSGFSDTVRLGDVSEVIEDNGISARIDVPSLDAVDPNPYWRMLILDEYSDGLFSMSSDLKRQIRNQEQTLVRYEGLGSQNRGVWTFYLEGGVSRFLPIPGVFDVIRFQAREEIQQFEDAHIHALDAVKQSVFFYQLQNVDFSDRFPAGPKERRILLGLEEQEESGASSGFPKSTTHLEVPPETRQQLADINSRITGGRDLNHGEYVESLNAFLETNFRYSLTPDGQISDRSASSDPVVNWLLEGSRGFCELFASSFVLLAREYGIPARMVVGFSGGAWNSVEEYFILRNRDAHAWVEVFDFEKNEWYRSDPTPGNSSNENVLSGLSAFQVEVGWDAWLDSLRIQWYRRVVNFEQEDQMALLSSVQEFTKEFSERFRSIGRSLLERLRVWFGGFSAAAALFIAIALAIAGGLVCVILWQYRLALSSLLLGWIHLGNGLSPSRRIAARYLEKFQQRVTEYERLEVYRSLQRIRYGEEIAPIESQRIFAQARKELRQL